MDKNGKAIILDKKNVYHWYKLISYSLDEHHQLIHPEHPLDEKKRFASNEVKRKWFLLGLAEAAPLIVGMIASFFCNIYFQGDLLLIGLIISIALIYFLKDKTPHPPIHFKTS